MNSVNFLKEELKIIFNKFNIKTLKYEFIKNRNIHLIEVIPSNLLIDSDFAFANLDLDDKFYELFPLEEIIFLSENSINKISEPIMVLDKLNESKRKLDLDDIFINISLLNNKFNFNNFKSLHIDLNNTFDINKELSDFYKKLSNNKTAFGKFDMDLKNFNLKHKHLSNVKQMDLKQIAGEENYAEAA